MVNVVDPQCLLRFGRGLLEIIISLQNVLSRLRPLPSGESLLLSEPGSASTPLAPWTFLPLLRATRAEM